MIRVRGGGRRLPYRKCYFFCFFCFSFPLLIFWFPFVKLSVTTHVRVFKCQYKLSVFRQLKILRPSTVPKLEGAEPSTSSYIDGRHWVHPLTCPFHKVPHPSPLRTLLPKQTLHTSDKVSGHYVLSIFPRRLCQVIISGKV